MATSTTNYNFKKPDESDFYDVSDQNKNWDLADEALKNLDTPTFEDYTGSTTVPSATDAINQIKSKGKLGTLLANIKAAFKGACLIGHIVNNCVTDNAKLPLSAAQGKVLKDLYTQLYSEVGTVSDNLSNRLIGQNANWFPNGTSLSGVLSGNVGVSAYGIKPDNAPSEVIPGGFGYGTLFAVCGRGDEGYGYGYAIYSGSNATGSRVFATFDNKNSGWSERISKSDLFASGFILDPSTCTVPFSIVNGWNSSAINIPEVAKNKQSILLTIWVYGTVSTGKLDATRIQALIVGQGGGTFTRIYDNSTWSDWA